MGKILFWAAVFAVLYLAFKVVSGSRRRDDRMEGGPDGKGEPMVQCAHCGVHLPVSDALTVGERAYCSSAHRDADA